MRRLYILIFSLSNQKHDIDYLKEQKKVVETSIFLGFRSYKCDYSIRSSKMIPFIPLALKSLKSQTFSGDLMWRRGEYHHQLTQVSSSVLKSAKNHVKFTQSTIWILLIPGTYKTATKKNNSNKTSIMWRTEDWRHMTNGFVIYTSCDENVCVFVLYLEESW